MARMFNAVLPENIGRQRVGADWDRGNKPQVRLPEETIRKLRGDLTRRVQAHELGSQKKYEAARAKRVARRVAYEHSPSFATSTGRRYLTEAELDVWYARIDKIRGKIVRAK